MRTAGKKLTESLKAVLPVTILILIVSFAFAPMPILNLGAFLFGAFLLILGMGLYSLGSDVSLEPMGRFIGSGIMRTKHVTVILLVALIIGIAVTAAEPDLTVLANQIASVPNWILIVSVSVGVGIFLLLSVLRILVGIPLKFLLAVSYGLIFILAIFADGSFFPLAFDSGGVTTGPVTVPFIMAFGAGLTAKTGGRKDDGFGVIGLCSAGPIVAVLLLGLLARPEAVAAVPELPVYADAGQMFLAFGRALPGQFLEVLIALAPMILFFLVYQIVFLRLPWADVGKVLIGSIYAYVGLSIFLLGVNVGFMTAGTYLGKTLGALPYRWIAIPLGMIVGAGIVLAEPAVQVLKRQVESATGGAIKGRVMLVLLALAVSVAVGLSMTRVLYGVSLWYFLAPGYALCIGLSFAVPDFFSALAFDSGGVASGPMASTFLLPFAIGASAGVGGNILTDAFGVIAMIAMTPILVIELVGLAVRLKTKRAAVSARKDSEEIIELDWQGKKRKGGKKWKGPKKKR